jgi:hypothetical protein
MSSIRTKFLAFFREIIHRTELHGLHFVFSNQITLVERFFWLVLVIFASFGAFNISIKQYDRYEANPTVISLERDYREWNGTLPAITLCYHRRIDENKAIKVIKTLWNVEQSDEEFQYFHDFISAVVYLNESFTRFSKFAKDERLKNVDMLKIAKQVHANFNSSVSSFDTNAEFTLNEIITEKGLCYTVNSVLWPLISTDVANQNKVNLKNKPLSCYFLKNQCYMKLDVFNPTVFVRFN